MFSEGLNNVSFHIHVLYSIVSLVLYLNTLYLIIHIAYTLLIWMELHAAGSSLQYAHARCMYEAGGVLCYILHKLDCCFSEAVWGKLGGS